jgi:hypothetical protein
MLNKWAVAPSGVAHFAGEQEWIVPEEPATVGVPWTAVPQPAVFVWNRREKAWVTSPAKDHVAVDSFTDVASPDEMGIRSSRVHERREELPVSAVMQRIEAEIAELKDELKAVS